MNKLSRIKVIISLKFLDKKIIENKYQNTSKRIITSSNLYENKFFNILKKINPIKKKIMNYLLYG